MENKDKMMTIVGTGLGISAPIYACLLIPGIPWTLQVERLLELYRMRECFRDEKFMLLNEDEEDMIDRTFASVCIVCLVIDLALIVFTCLIYKEFEGF